MKRRMRKTHTPDQQEKQRRRGRIFRWLGRTIFTLVLLVAAVVALTVFFKVKTISVEGAMQYDSEELIAGMDIKKGDNLYLWDKNRVLADLMRDFPYLESAQLRRRLPDALVLTVTECSAAVAVQNEDNTYTYLSAEGKVLEQSAESGSLPVVTGLSLQEMQTGSLLQTATDVHVDALLEILQTMDAGEMLDKLAFLNLQDLTDIRIGYEKRFDIRVGTTDDLAYRLRFAQTVIEERLSPSDIGRLYWDTQGRLHYVPDTEENVARSASDLSAAPITSPEYTNPDGEVGTTDPDAANPDAANPDETDSGEPAADGSEDSYDESYENTYEDSYDESYENSYEDGSYEDGYEGED